MTAATRPSSWAPGLRWQLVALGSAGACGLVVALGGPAGIVLLLAGVLAAYAAAFLPGVVLAGYFLIAFYKGLVQPFSPIDLTIALAALNAVQLVPLAIGGRWRHLPRSGVALWLALTALVASGVLYAPDQRVALETLVTWVLLVLVPLTAGAVRVASEPRFVRQFLWVLFGSSVVAVIAGLALMTGSQRLVIPGTNTIGVGRAALLVPIVGVTFVLGVAPAVLRTAAIVAVPFAIAVAVASGSRGPLVAFGLLAGIGLLRQVGRPGLLSPRRVVAFGGVVLGSIAVLGVLGAALPELSVARFASFGDFIRDVLSGDISASSSDISSGQRVRLFDLAVAMFAGHPVLGAGTAGYAVLTPFEVGREWASSYPHNTLLQFAAEFGLVGVALFSIVVLRATTRPLPPGREWHALRAVLVFFLLNTLVSGDIYTDRQLWALVALILLAGAASLAPDTGTEHVGTRMAPVSGRETAAARAASRRGSEPPLGSRTSEPRRAASTGPPTPP